MALKINSLLVSPCMIRLILSSLPKVACNFRGFLYLRKESKSEKPQFFTPNSQSFRLQIQRSGFDSRQYQIFWEVVGLERGSFSLVSTTEELLGRKRSGSGLETREYVHRDPLCWPRNTLYPKKLALTSPTSGGRSARIVRSPTQTTEFVYTSV
jgi:hypothetical protein